MTSVSERRCRVPAAFVFVLVALSLTSCGGGTDVAPSQPVVEGDGFGAATLAGVDFGQTSQVDAAGAGAQNASRPVNRVVDVRPDGFILLEDQLASPVVVLTSTDGLGTTYCWASTANLCPGRCGGTDCDFWVQDPSSGVLRVNPGASSIPPAPSTVNAAYTASERFVTFNVGISFAAGRLISLAVFNIPTGTVAPVDISAVEGSAPLSPFPMAFNVIVQTGITSAAARETFTAVPDPANLLTLTALDTTNEQNPCLAGTVHVVLQSDATGSLESLDASFETPGC